MFSSVLQVKNLFFVTLLENGGEYWSVREREKQREMCNGRETGVKYVFRLEGIRILERTRRG
jgi:hypothetical protein